MRRKNIEANAPEEQEHLLVNRAIPAELKQKLYSHLDEDEAVLFGIVGDLNLSGKYEDTLLAATEARFLVIDKETAISYPYDGVVSAKVKRMYGNAAIVLERKGEKKCRVFRFTYAIASLCDMAAQFIASLSNGGNLDEEMEIVKATFDKINLICSRCGRPLLRAGAPCIHCQSKGKIASKLFKYIKPELIVLSVCILISAITTAIALLPPFMTQKIVDDIIPMRDAGNVAGGLQALTIVVIILVVAHLLNHALAALRALLLRRSGDRIVMNLRNDVYDKAQHLPMSFYDKTSTGAVINRISGDTATIQSFILKITQECIVQLILLIGIVVIMLVLNWRLTLLSLIPVPIVAVCAKIFSKKVRPYYIKIWKRWTAVTSIMTDTIPCIRVVKAFAGEKRAVKKFERYNKEWYKVSSSSARLTQTVPHIIGFAVTCGTLLIWAIGGRWAMLGTVSTGMLVSFISYATMFYGPVNFFANLQDSYQAAIVSVERIFDILDSDPEQNTEDGAKPTHLKGRIEFRHVNFSFDKTKRTLSDINLVIEPGDIVGIVGTTGSGKSTLINLLLRFYDHYEGEILVDGVNIKDMDIGYFRNCIGYVQQEPMMFSDTIFNNIAYGMPDASIEQVIYAAEVANAHEFIVRQPDAYDSMLGERGVGLSGGEKQRISIARAVLKNPSLLVFDEATAAVDSETEHLIQEAIERLISGRTTLMIAHRLSTLRKANKIIVLDQGRIIECGSHDELMALKGKYYKLIEIQAMGKHQDGLTVPN